MARDDLEPIVYVWCCTAAAAAVVIGRTVPAVALYFKTSKRVISMATGSGTGQTVDLIVCVCVCTSLNTHEVISHTGKSSTENFQRRMSLLETTKGNIAMCVRGHCDQLGKVGLARCVGRD